MNIELKIDKNFLIESPKIEEIDMSPKKINIYFFWGKDCPHCEELKQFLSKNKRKIRKKANIYTFEIWNNKENANLYFEFTNHFKHKTNSLSVPYMVIGEEEVKGYSYKLDKHILKTINEQYKKRKEIDKFANILKQ